MRGAVLLLACVVLFINSCIWVPWAFGHDSLYGSGCDGLPELRCYIPTLWLAFGLLSFAGSIVTGVLAARWALRRDAARRGGGP